MDVESYDFLVLKAKQSLDTRVCRKVILASHLSTVLEECNRCVSLSLDLVVKLLEKNNIEFNKLCSYLEDAVTLIQMLSDFIKCTIESTAMECCSMQSFPVTTGNILFTVFMHCKDSEIIYGKHLKSVETPLKDLFRTCHELQLTYLMTMEKHFIFDLTENDEKEILMEALDINMKIGEIVQALDVKTMAEQWKAFTVICEKYSNFLLNNNVYNKCTHLFASIIKHNIKTAMESEGDNKTMMRSLKIANFTIKLLLKVSNIFKHGTTNNFENVAELLLYIYMHNQAYLESVLDKPQQFTSIVQTNIVIPTDSLCNILLQDARFLDHTVYKIDVRKLDRNTFLGYIILLTSLMKTMLHWKEDQALLVSQRKIIECVYRILPLGHCWFNIGLQFLIKDTSGFERCFGLYEYLLVHMIAFASTFNRELYEVLEKYMYEAILDTDCYAAMFSSNLWVHIARISSSNLVSNTLQSLINVYERLKSHPSFQHSPQYVHLHYTIGKFFEILPAEEMKQFYLENNVDDAIRVCNLPNQLRKSTEAVVLENLKTSFSEIFEASEVTENDFVKFIQTIKIAATCSFKDNDTDIEKYVMKIWSKACNANIRLKMDTFITKETVWYYQYLEAIVALIECMEYKFSSSYNAGKILHVMSTIMGSCNTEIIVLLFDLFCTLTLNRRDDENRNVIESTFKQSLHLLLQSVESNIRALLLRKLSKYTNSELFRELTTTILYEDPFLRNEWNLYSDDNCYKYDTEWSNHLEQAENFVFIHKCLRTDFSNESEQSIKTSQSNFDLGDFIFESSSSDTEEPSRKKAKLDLNSAECLIEKIENDVNLLCQNNSTLPHDHKKRIRNVVNKLRNIIS